MINPGIIQKYFSILQTGKTVLYAKRKGAIAGSDFSGTVLTIGSDVRPGVRSVGERVAGFVYGGLYLYFSASIFITQ